MYRISEIAKMTGLAIPTLRYYEELGILKPTRNGNNYREYSDKDITWIEFILRLKEIGMDMQHIVKYSELREHGDDTILDRMALLDFQQEKLTESLLEIQSNITFLEKKKATYRKMLDNQNHDNDKSGWKKCSSDANSNNPEYHF